MILFQNTFILEMVLVVRRGLERMVQVTKLIDLRWATYVDLDRHIDLG